jgi:hypothetical protein
MALSVLPGVAALVFDQRRRLLLRRRHLGDT